MTTTVEVGPKNIIRRRYKRACQELDSLRNKEGLVDIKHLSREEDSWFYVGKGKFRRSLDKGESEFPRFSFRQFMFLSPYCGMWEGTAKRLVELHKKNENISIYFAGILSETGGVFAAPDVYFGPQSILHINNLNPTSKALTVVYDNELIARTLGNLPIPRTEMFWKKNGNEVTLEAERIHDLNKSSMRYHTKYFHAMFPLGTGVFNHFDGSIKEYSPEEFSLREATTIDKLDIFTKYFKNPLIWQFFFNESREIIQDYEQY